MKTKARIDSIRKRQKVEEKYNWDRMSDSDSERQSHKIRVLIAAAAVVLLFFTLALPLYSSAHSSATFFVGEEVS